jgi:glycosyltransferase involved in cell wall biosynthesis
VEGQTRPSLTLTLSPASHYQKLAEACLNRGLLGAVIRFGRNTELLQADSTGGLRLARRFQSYPTARRITWGVWRRLPVVGRAAPLPAFLTAWLDDRRIAGWLPRTDIFQGLMGVCLATLRQARRMGAITLIDQSTLHPAAWQREVLTDCARAGLDPRKCERVLPAVLIRRYEREYEACDKVLVYSTAAQRSFQPFPYAGKAVVVHPGVDHELFVPPPAPRRDAVFRVCYVGRIEAPKGLQYLLDAWKRLALPHAELALAGHILPEMAWLRTEGPALRVKLAGILNREELARFYRQADLFVFPSMNEGLSLALLEAMSSGLPVVAAIGTGAEDCVTAGQNGFLVPGRNPEALAETILWASAHRGDLPELGRAARARIAQRFTLSHYHARLIELYESLWRGSPRHPTD